MKTAVAAIALSMASVAYSQAITDLPNCAVNCFVQVLSNDGCSSLGDFECHCKKPGLVESVTPCVEKACSVADQETVVKDVVALCQEYGVQLTIPATKTATIPTSAPGYASPSSPATVPPVNNNNPAPTTTAGGNNGSPTGPSSSPAGGVVAPPNKSAPVAPYSSAPAYNNGGNGAAPSSSGLIATIPLASSPVIVGGNGNGNGNGNGGSSTSRAVGGVGGAYTTPYRGTTPTTPGVPQFTGGAAAGKGVGAAAGVAAAFVAAVF
ncbi:hypothetical protein IWX90DRAFT_226254 [Phyllosticta citrichinensis]|uniref:CFEM domain-containing protein n=1 Tax=Phyllosticta citrichinensis TaxID=1130410 RepID=A0ABR1XUN3_9PEZI